MKFLVVLSAAVAAIQCATILPHHGLGLGFGIHAIPSVAKSTIKYKIGAFEPVDVETPADAVKIELVETEHEQEILTPTESYATHGYAGYPYGLIHAAAPEVVVKEAEPVELPALHLGGFGYGLGAYGVGYPYGLIHAAAPELAVKEAEPVELPALHLGGFGYGLGAYGVRYPYGLVHAAAPEIEVKEVELPKLDLGAIHYGGYGYGGLGHYGGLGYHGGLLGFPHALPVVAAAEETATAEE